MRVELTDDPTAFTSRDWSGLVRADPLGSFFHTPGYLKLWWEEFGSGRLLLAFVLDGDRTVAMCAFELTGETLRFLGGFDVTDYMGPVGLPGSEDAAGKELLCALSAEASWATADLRGLPLHSPWSASLEQAAAGQGFPVERVEDGVAPAIALPGTFDEYMAGLPSKLRHELRRKARRLAEVAGPYRVTLSTEETLARDLDRFFELHRSSPGPKGRFMHAGMEIFFRRLGEAFLPPHIFHLAFLEVEGERTAGGIGFAYKDTFSLYNSAFDRGRWRLAPGMVLVAELIRLAILSGRDTFDLLKGDLEYKYRFGSTPRPVGRLLLGR